MKERGIMDVFSITGTVFEFFQALSLICALLTLFFTVKRSCMNGQWYFDIPMILLMTHVIIYYIVVFLVRYSFIKTSIPYFFTSWSTTLRFHSIATLCILAVVNYVREKRKVWKL
jgi:hypothetical protein